MVREVQPWEHIKVQLGIVALEGKKANEIMVHKPTMVTMTWQRCYASPGIWEMRSRWMKNCSTGCPAEEAGLLFEFFCPILDVC